MKVFFIVLRILVGITFVFSAYVKMFPAELLELAIVETSIVGWSVAPFVARLLIGVEFFLGIMLITGLYSRLTIKVSILVLSVFTVYLLVILITQGNQDNCNCFGMDFALTPLQSIIKNILMLISLFFILKYTKVFEWRYSKHITIVVLVISITIPFLFAHIVVTDRDFFAEPLNQSIDLDLLYDEPGYTAPSVELRKGKWVVAFMTTSCRFCVIAGYKLNIINNSIDELPLHILIAGSDEGIRDYHFTSKTRNIPQTRIEYKTFYEMLGTPSVRFPSIFFVEDGVIKYRPSTHGFNEKDIKRWLEE